MTLKDKVKQTVIRGRSLPAIVVDYLLGKATVKLSYNGALMRGLQVVGGPVDPGQYVQVDFTTPTPTVVAIAKEWVSADDLANALNSVTSKNLTADTVITITLFSGGQAKEMYPSDGEGLQTALSDAGIGDVIYLPDVEVFGTFTVPADVTMVGLSSRQSIIRGKVLLNNNSTLENLCVMNGEYTLGIVYGVDSLADSQDEAAIIRDCEIHGYNCAEGTGYAVVVETDCYIYIEKSVCIADSALGTAYTFYVNTGGFCEVTHCKLYGTNGHDDGAGITVYSNVEYKSEIARGCIPVVYDNSRSFWIDNNVTSTIQNLFQNIDPSGVASQTANNFAGFTSQKYACGAVKSGRYIYIPDWSSTSDYRIGEYDIDGDSYQYLTFATKQTATQQQNIRFAVVDDRIVYALEVENIYLAETRRIFKLDFNTMTVTEEFNFEVSPNPEHAGAIDSNWNLPRSILCFEDNNNEIVCVITGWYSEYDEAYDAWDGIYFLYKNITQDSGWEICQKIMFPNMRTSWYIFFWTSPVVVSAKYVVVAPSIGTTGWQEDLDHKYYAVPIFNIETFEIKMQTRMSDISYGRDSNCYYSAAGNDDGLAFLTVEYGNETAGCTVYAIQPEDNEFDDNYYDSSSYWVELYAGRHNVWAYDEYSDEWWAFGGLGPVYVRDFPQPASSFYTHDGTCKSIDINDRVWYYDFTTQLLRGMKIDDSESDITIDADLTLTTAGYTLVMLLDDVIVLCHRTGSGTYTINYYLLDVT